MKRTFITAILLAITTSSVNAQQSNTVVGSSQQNGAVASGYQSYQTQVPQYRVQPSQSGYYQNQPLQSYQQPSYVPQQGTIQTYYYPHQQPVAGGVVSQPQLASPAQSNGLMQSVVEQNVVEQSGTLQVEALQAQASQDYLALPTKARPPAPSIPPQPEDLVGQPVESGQQSVLVKQRSQELPTGEQLALPSNSLAPAPSIPMQTGEMIAQSEITRSEIANAVNQLEAKETLEAVEEPQVDETASISDLVATPEADTVEETLEAVEEPVVEEVAAAEVLPATNELDSSEELAADEKLAAVEEPAGIEELAGDEEPFGTEELSDVAELVADAEGSEELSKVAMAEFGMDDEVESTELKPDDLTLEEPKPEPELKPEASAASIATSPAVIKEEVQIAETQPPVQARVAAPIVPTVRHIVKSEVAATEFTPEKTQRSSSYGGWLLGLLLLTAVPVVAWFVIRKKKRIAQEIRLAELALPRGGLKKPMPSLTDTARPAPAVKESVAAPALATALAKEKAASPVAATAKPPVAQPQEIKKAPAASIDTPSKAVSASGVLTMDDIKGVELDESDAKEKVANVTAPANTSVKSSPVVEPSAVNRTARMELPTDEINNSTRDSLLLISGIDDATQHALYKAGYLSFGDLAKASEREIQLALSKCEHRFTSSDFKRWIVQAASASQGKKRPEVATIAIQAPLASDVTPVTEPKTAGDDLTKIRGIGPATAELLRTNGITSFVALSQVGVTRLQEILMSGGAKFAALDPSMWCRQAEFAIKSSSPSSPAETVQTQADSEVKPTSVSQSTAEAKADAQTTTQPLPAVPASEAPATQADDLTKIAGVGLEAQSFLRSMGIERFEQVGQMTADELHKLLAIQGGRCGTLDAKTWPVQARALATDLSEESSLLDQVNSIIDIATSSSTAPTKSDVSEAVADKATSKQ